METKNEIDTITERLNSLPEPFDDLKRLAVRYQASGRIQQGCVRLGRFRKYDHDHFHITIFPPANPEWLVQERGFEVPLQYLQMLSYMNGLVLFDISLFGFTPSMQEQVPRLDRSRLQCLDLTTANETWIISIRNAPREMLYFGAGPHSSKEDKHFFMNEGGRVRAVLKGGGQVGEWSSLWDLIAREGAAEEQRVLRGSSS